MSKAIKRKGGAKITRRKTGLRVRSNKKGGLELVMSPKLSIKLSHASKMK